MITKKYIPSKELAKYRLIMAVTLAPLRTSLAESPVFSGLYNRIKKKAYAKA